MVRTESLRRRPLWAVVRRSIERARGRFGMRLTHFTVQRDHLHLVIEGVESRALRSAMTGLNVRIARGLNRVMKTSGRRVAERYHTRILRTPREVRHVVRYVLGNTKHHGGEATWDLSSRAYPELVETPRSWLLKKALDLIR